jgi:carbon monoxide dehydrogenase subunit G
MKTRIIAELMVFAFALTACGFPVRFTEVRGSGNVITETRTVSGFNAVELSGIGTLIIEQGAREALEITAEDNLMSHIKSNISGSRLQLGGEEFVNMRPTKDIIYRLKVKNLSQIESSGLGKMEMKKLASDNLTIEISGSGRVSLDNLEAKTLSIEISGLGDISINGSVESQQIKISGAGNYKAPNLASKTASVDISGTGTAILWVTEQLDLDLSGAGTIHYYGSPQINSDISGAGVVKNLGDK